MVQFVILSCLRSSGVVTLCGFMKLRYNGDLSRDQTVPTVGRCREGADEGAAGHDGQ